MKRRALGALTIAAVVAAVVAGISYAARNKRAEKKSTEDYFDHISPYL